MARTVASLPAGSRISDYISLDVIAKFFPLARVRAVLAETGRASIRERDLLAHIEMGQGALRRVAWREGSDRKLQSRFVAVRVRPAHRDYWRAEPHEKLWLLAEWSRGAEEPTKYWLADLPAETTLEELVRQARHRWIVERDYLELKQELPAGAF